MTFWTIAQNDLRLSFKDKMFFFWLLVFPLLFALVFGLVATAVTAFIFFYIQLYRMTKIMVEEMCVNCGNRLPRGASFCPYCGSTIGKE